MTGESFLNRFLFWLPVGIIAEQIRISFPVPFPLFSLNCKSILEIRPEWAGELFDMSETGNKVLEIESAEGGADAELGRGGRARTTAGSGLAWLVLAALIWGTVGVSSALINRIETTPPMWIGFLRLAFAAPFLVGLAWLSTGRNPFRLTRREWGYYTGMGLAMACYQITYFLAIPISSVTLVVVIALCSSPLIVALLSIPIFKERLTRRLMAALGLALVGTALLAFGGGKDGEVFKPEYLLGAILALGTGLAYSTLVICSKLAAQAETEPGRTPRGPVQPTAVAFSLGACVMLLVALFTGSVKLEMAPGVWGIAAYLGVIPTGLAYIIFLKGLAKASATAASITTMLEPSVAAFLAWALLGEQLGLASLLGSALLLGSVLLLSKK
jgi:drug/metabolite transporter, DME family